jgi:glycosyltransferase involved in cell wall biosynthesis
MRFESLLVAFLFRLTNRDGLIYVRMDIDPGVMKSYEKYPQKIVEMSKNILIAFFIKIARVDFVSVETKTLYEYFKERHPVYKKMSKLYYLPMGFNLERVPPRSVCFSDKENLVIHVARIGLPAKRSHIVLESFAEVVRKYKNWKLILIGEMQDSFIEYYNTFLSNNQDVSGNISYLGFISNREHLFDIYSRSKILFLPSQYESFGLATLESGLFGNILLGSDIIAFRELTNNGEYAYLCPSNSSAGFVSMLDYMITHEDEMADKSKIVASYMTDNYDIKTLCMKLRNIIDEINCIRSGL